MFGKPMQYWSEMPRGMWLRSPWHASTISDPRDALTLSRYEATVGRSLERPVRLEDFVAYGRWFQEHVAPDLDSRHVSSIESDGDGFRLVLEDGEALLATRAVVATGLLGAEHRPADLSGLPDEFVSHASRLHDPRDFYGRRVLVIGGGQSATESAALLHEAGADVEIVMRAPAVNWLDRSGRLHHSRFRPLLYPDTDVGPVVLNHIVNKPRLFSRFPRNVQAAMARRSIRPAAASWLRPRLADVPITCGRRVASMAVEDGMVAVRLGDGSERRVDHVIQATGYRPDVRSHPLLASSLAGAVQHLNGYPLLSRAYEASVPGLHFVGASSAVSHGPVMRFVSGTWATGPAIANGIGGAMSTARSRARPRAAIAHAGQTAS
jgi:hypothetical protein